MLNLELSLSPCPLLHLRSWKSCVCRQRDEAADLRVRGCRKIRRTAKLVTGSSSLRLSPLQTNDLPPTAHLQHSVE